MTELNLHNLKISKKKKAKRVGRGNSSGSGTYSGRGLKGQRARSGGKGGLKRKGLVQTLKSKPKLGGFKSLKEKPAIINLDTLENFFEEGEAVDINKVFNKGLIKTKKNGLKVLGSGSLTKKFTVKADNFSESAKKAIMDAGGKIEEIAKAARKSAKKAKKKVK